VVWVKDDWALLAEQYYGAKPFKIEGARQGTVRVRFSEEKPKGGRMRGSRRASPLWPLQVSLAGMVAMVSVCGLCMVWQGCDREEPASFWGPPGRLKIAVDCSATRVMDDFADPDLNQALRDYLAASSEWRVGLEGRYGQIARRRTPKGRPNENVQVHVALGFDLDSLPANTHPVLDSAARAGQASVEVCQRGHADDIGRIGTSLLVTSPRVWLNIIEWNHQTARTGTSAAIQEVAETLNKVKSHAQAVLSGEYAEGMLPPGSACRQAQDSVNVAEETTGIYTVSGYVNAGERGYLSMSIRNATTGDLLTSDLRAAEGREFVGFSRDPQQKFYFETEMMVDLGETGVDIPARFELWFTPTTSRMISQVTRVVRSWEP
jgi:hypothetical protein